MRLTAVVLAGGHSRRMGVDKALLRVPGHATLLERQLSLARSLAPVELLVSCRPTQRLPIPPGVRRIHDEGTCGPLGGVAAALAAARGDALLILGVDLARIHAPLLAKIVNATAFAMERPARVGPVSRDFHSLAAPRTSGSWSLHGAIRSMGSIARTSRGIEPLASVYPLAALSLAHTQLESGTDLSLRRFATSCFEAGLARWYDVAGWDEFLFANINRPADLRSSQPQPPGNP